MVRLETERLVLRRFRPEDEAALFALYRDPEIPRYFPDGTRTLAETRAENEWFLDVHPHHPKLGLWATAERTSGTFLGRCGLLAWKINGTDEMELAFLISKSRWSQRRATEAARAIVQCAKADLKRDRLICLITPGNAASVRVAEKLGMRFERNHTDEFGLCHVYALATARSDA